ncbi:HAD hydrolase family protein [Aurantivibrio plasticivorans]
MNSSALPAQTTEKLRQIKLLLLDVDGILTDGKLYFGNQGEELKAFNILDGQGIRLLQDSGVKVGIVTGRKSELVARRARDLDIAFVIQGSKNKRESVTKIAQEANIALDNIAFMGDDYPDLIAMQAVGLSFTVTNAHEEIKQRVDWQSQYRGGDGAVREACDIIMKAQGTYEDALNKFLQ